MTRSNKPYLIPYAFHQDFIFIECASKEDLRKRHQEIESFSAVKFGVSPFVCSGADSIYRHYNGQGVVVITDIWDSPRKDLRRLALLELCGMMNQEHHAVLTTRTKWKYAGQGVLGRPVRALVSIRAEVRKEWEYVFLLSLSSVHGEDDDEGKLFLRNLMTGTEWYQAPPDYTETL